MGSYYRKVYGTLAPGKIAKSSDINHIQLHIEEALSNLLSDLHDNESFSLGSGDGHRNDFLLTAAPKTNGKYIDELYVFEEEDNWININKYDVRQPIPKTKTSLYSVVTKLKNTSKRDIPIEFEIQTEDGTVLRKNNVVLAKEKTDKYEIVFDLDYYPTAFGLDYEDLLERDGKDIARKTNEVEESYDESYEEEHANEQEIIKNSKEVSTGVSVLYLVIKRANVNAIDLYENGDEDIKFDPETSLGVCCKAGSDFPQKDMFAEIRSEKNPYTLSDYNIYFECIYAKEMTYLCEHGVAIINGRPVTLKDTHISVSGSSAFGNTLTWIYMDENGHLKFSNSETSTSTNIKDFSVDINDPIEASHYPIAIILTYSNAIYGTAKEPLIIQDEYGQRPRSHHERIRRLEKRLNWTSDVAIPSRIKYTLTGDSIVDRNGDELVAVPNVKINADVEKLSSKNIILTTNSKGDAIVVLSEVPIQKIPVTLKEKTTDEEGKSLKLEDTDVLNVSSFSKKENIVHDSKAGTLVLDKVKTTSSKIGVAMTDEEGKATEFNPWDDSEGNRPDSDSPEVHEREYTVVKGNNDKNDEDSFFPAMTFYTDTNYTLKKLELPVQKFKNCSAVKFFIYKRQDANDKQNVVPLEQIKKKLYKSKEFSLNKAKVKGDYQYMEDGFTIDFGEGGLSLSKGQYIIIVLPVPKSGKGSVYIETYKPKNSKDFCIKYRGASNGSWFELVDHVQEVWYNSAKVTAEKEEYAKTGTIISNTLKWSDPYITDIKSIKPIANKSLTAGKNCSYKLFVKTGGKWQEVTVGKENLINSGGGKSFTWKLEFHGDGKNTPKLEYNDEDKAAITFVIKRQRASSTISQEVVDINKNMCITSSVFDADKILSNYVGDPNLGYDDSKFSHYEFARLWMDKDTNKDVVIDIQGSDRDLEYEESSTGISRQTPLWSYHYTDLTLDDFSKINVDYSDYTEELEEDENNLKFKFDAEHGYNDSYIKLTDFTEFDRIANAIDDTTNQKINFVNKNDLENNQLFLRHQFANPIDLTKYTGIKLRFRAENAANIKTKLSGIGIYLSNSYESEVPSDIKNRPENIEAQLTNEDAIPPIIDPEESSYEYYDGNIIEINHVHKDEDGEKAYQTGYYRYVKEYDDNKGRFIYKRTQVFDLRSFNLYKANTITYQKTVYTAEDIQNIVGAGNENNSETNPKGLRVGDMVEDSDIVEIRIEIDQESNNLKNVREIGLISLNDEGSYQITTEQINGDDDNVNENKFLKLTFEDIRAIDQNSIKIFDPWSEATAAKVLKSASDKCVIYNPNNITIKAEQPESTYHVTVPTINKEGHKRTTPRTAQINIKHKSFTNSDTEVTLCYINSPYEGNLSKYKHIGIQLASDIYIPKNSLKINLCSEPNGVNVFKSINVPTFNTVYDPRVQLSKIVLSDIIAKMDAGDEKIRSVSISTTKNFKNHMDKVVADDAPSINLFLGIITIYRAETIPMFHKKLRYKFYATENGEILTTLSDADEGIEIRKIGAVLDYN